MRFSIRDICWLILVCAVSLSWYKQRITWNEKMLAKDVQIQALKDRIAQNIINDKRNYQALANNLKNEMEDNRQNKHEIDRLKDELRNKQQEVNGAMIEVYNLKEQLKQAAKVEQ